MSERFVLIGAGSAMFTRGLIRDMINLGIEAELALVDIDPEALNVAEHLAKKMIQAGRANLRLSATTDRRKALPNATVVISTIAVGGRRGWELDVQIPRKYGVYQPVGDTAMAGGASRALRMIPAMVDIARDVLELAPHALFFNYANPMTANCRAVHKATGAAVVGLCHGVFGVAGYLARCLGTETARLGYTAVGINHLTWFTEVRMDGRDAMGQLRQVAEHKIAKGENPFSWWCLQTFGAFPAVCDRHVVEFFGHLFAGEGGYYGKTLGVDAFSIEKVITAGDDIYKQMKHDALSDGPLPDDYMKHISGEHEQVIEIVDSIRRDARRVYSANLANRGIVGNLPDEAVIECPAVAGGSGLRAISQLPLPPGIAGAVCRALNRVEIVVDAALEGSRAKFVQALALDGCVRSTKAAEDLAAELLGAHAEHLPQFAR